MFQDLYLAAVSAPFIAFLTWACLRNYRGEAELLSWDHKGTVRFCATTFIAGMLIAILIYDIIMGLFSQFWWCNLVWIPHSVLLALWVLMLRAAVLSKAT